MHTLDNKTYSLNRTLLIALFLFICTSNVNAAASAEVKVGESLRDVSMQGLLVKSKKISEFRGKPLIINVWASWCGPCRAEMASLERLSQRFGGRQFNVIGISTDDERRAALQLIIESKLSFSNYLDSNLTLEHMLGAHTIPLTIFVDEKGTVVRKVRGSQVWDSAESVTVIRKTFKINM